ncbi:MULTISPECIES: ATP-grasp domain-containing protein [Bacillaceae]|uniref:ATP-grasp domain-containing protein n=1 Tax=Bacillaceae TaxID=186817 RepID=UPI000BFC4AF3|nr:MULTISPECIES: ATP-grasp domain-containing protein [Bacillaceae]PGT82986.1 carbamoyl-phosphate-synthetase [Bacillus sp. AFS040349]UGB29486.1 ATP-grasp domain-containing protein [Metabacillus sp. B2-18]
MKKILFLGGSIQQLPVIRYAKEKGYYIILCDYLPDNPGIPFSQEYHCVSTDNKEAVLKVAKDNHIDGIIGYISDAAALTAAYVANKLDLPSNPFESVLTLVQKDLFRKFLKKNGFHCPKAESYKTVEEAKKGLEQFNFPLMVKPIDSSGSKGISRIDSIEECEGAFKNAAFHSKSKEVIIEEYIERSHDYQIGGDVFVKDGKLEFCGFLNCHRNTEVNPYVPVGKSYPILINQEKVEIVCEELNRILKLLDIKYGALNLEVLLGKNDKVYFIEIGPRNGGNLIPEFLKAITGIDFIKATVETALGNHEEMSFNFIPPKEGYYSTYTIHSLKKGKLVNINFSDEIKEKIIYKVIYKDKGDEIDIFNSGNKAIGFIFIKFDSLEEQRYKMHNMGRYINVQVEEEIYV